MRVNSWQQWLKKSMVLMLVCGFVAAVPLDARADWHDQYGTVVVYGSNGGSAGGSHGSSGGSWGSSGGSHGSSGGSWGSSGGSSGGSFGGISSGRGT